MLRLGIGAWAVTVLALAGEFTFSLGSPVASQDFRAKAAAFVFRTQGCADPAKSQISGTVEGLVKGTRRSLPLNVTTMSQPGVYAVYRTWPVEGEWVVSLKGTCTGVNAGAIVPIGPKGFIRESSKFFSRPATDAEIEMALKELTQGANK